MPGCRCLAIAFAAETMKDMSGSFVFERRRHADVDGVEILDDGEIGGSIEQALRAQRLYVSSRDVGNIRTALINRLDFPEVEVDAGDMKACLAEFHCQRKANVAEAHDAQTGGPGPNFFTKLFH